MEVPHLLVVLPQARHRLRGRDDRVGRHGPAAPAARVEDPAAPPRQVGDAAEHDDRQERRDPFQHECAEVGAVHAGGPAGADRPEERQQPERGDVVDARPLRRGRGAQAQAGRDQPPVHDERTERRVAAALGDLAGELRAGRVAVEQQAGEAGEDPEQQEDVEDGGAAGHQVHAVEGQQQPGGAAEERRPGHPPRHPRHDQHRERADQRAGEPPPERVHAEHPLADGDEPLARRRVGDETAARCPDVEVRWVLHEQLVGVLDRVVLVAEVQERPGVLGVVGLVEDDRARLAELVEAQHAGDQRHEQRAEPAHQPTAGDARREPLAQRRRVFAPIGPDLGFDTCHRHHPDIVRVPARTIAHFTHLGSAHVPR